MLLATNTTQYQESLDYTPRPRQQPSTVTSINGCHSTTALRRFENLRNTLAPLRLALLNHPVLRGGRLAKEAAGIHADARLCRLGFYVLGEAAPE
jgi:hypothetical protein